MSASPSLVPVYVAHRLQSGDRAENLRNASRWAAWLARRYYVEPVCPWIVLASVSDESERDLGLEIDRAVLHRSDLRTIAGFGPWWTSGMLVEKDEIFSRECIVACVDLTGPETPDDITDEWLRKADGALGCLGVERRAV
jgi:hypothetical protein